MSDTDGEQPSEPAAGGENVDVDETGAQLEAAATVFAARRRIDGAIADLASRPLDQEVADQMRTILASPALAEARRALTRLTPSRPTRPNLRIVEGSGTP